jgi:parallel beta-helix repeat protein
LALSAHGLTYYVDSSALDDSKDGQSASTAWKTIAKVNSVIASGDMVYFRHGRTWNEELVLPNGGTNLTVGDYDNSNGNLPVICGSDVIPASFANSGTPSPAPNVYYITNITDWPNHVIFDGKMGNDVSQVQSLAQDTNFVYDYPNKILYVYSTTNPNARVIENMYRDGVNANNASSVIIQNLMFQECQNGIYNTNNDTHVLGCRFFINSICLSLDGSGCVVSGNTITPVGGWLGISVRSNNALLSNNIFTINPNNQGLLCDTAATNTRIFCNNFTGDSPMEIHADQCTVVGNSITSGSSLDIRSGNNLISGNVFTGAGIEISDSGSDPNYLPSPNNVISQNLIQNSQSGGPVIWLGDQAVALICNNTITACYDGIELTGSGNTVTCNVVTHTTDSGWTAAITCDNNGSGNLIVYNLCHDCASSGIYICYSSDNRIWGNVCYNCTYGFTLDSDPGNPSSTGNQVARNRIYNCSQGGMACWGPLLNANQLCYNLVYDCPSGLGIYFQNDSIDATGNRVENNVVMNCQTGLQADGTGVKACNNIFVNNNSNNNSFVILENQPLAVHSNNCFYNTNTPLNAVWVNASGSSLNYNQILTYEPTAVTANPQFVNSTAYDFHLKYTSPCIDKGVTTGYLRDFEGTQVPLGYFDPLIKLQDIGAFEYFLSPHLTSLSWVQVQAGAFPQGSNGNDVGQINCSSYQYDILQSMTVKNLGTAKAGSDITALRLVFSPTTGNSLTAAAVGAFTYTGNSTWTLNGLNHHATDSGSYYLLADIAPNATLGHTCCFSLAAGQAQFQISGAFPATNFSNIDSQVINAVLIVTPEIAVDLASANVIRTVKGATSISLGSAPLYNFTGHSVVLTSLKLGLQTPDGRTIDPSTVFAGLRLIPDNGSSASYLTAPFGQGLLFTFLTPLVLASQSRVTYQIQGDISASPSEKQFRFVIPDSQNLNTGLTLSQPVSGKAFPLVTNPVSIRDPQISTTFSNYPNPFTPSQGPTRIGYYLSQEAQVKLLIWTLDHRLVKEVVNEKQAEGMQETTWDGRNGEGYMVRNGAYLLTLECTYTAGGHDAFTRKIAVAK